MSAPQNIKEFEVYPTSNSVSVHARQFQPDVNGAGSVYAGVRDVLEGRQRLARWVVAGHPIPSIGGSRTGQVYRVITIGLGDDQYGRCLRYLEGGYDPNGAETSDVVETSLELALDAGFLASVISMELGKIAGKVGAEVFRVVVMVPAKVEFEYATA